MPKVSVLMPIYNTNLKYLKEAIESVLNQTYQDFEFLILNDSPDNQELGDFVKSFADTRIKYFENRTNMGITPSRNKLISLAESEYLMVMDHDDISLPTRIDKQVSYLDAHPDVGVIGCNVKNLIGDKITYYPVENEAIEERLMCSCAISHSGCMIRKSVLLDNDIRYESVYSPAEDYSLFCRLIGKTKFYNIPEVLFLYRNHADNTTHRQKEKMDHATFLIYDMVRKEHQNIWEKVLEKGCVVSRIRILGLPVATLKKRGQEAKATVDKFHLANLYNKTKSVFKLFNLIPLITFYTKGKKIKGYLFNKILVFESKNKFNLK